jgi:hypothetical protein
VWRVTGGLLRRLAVQVDQLPAWAFVGAAALLFGAARGGRLFALVHESRGGMELGGILTLAVFLGVLIFAVRRRQCSAWEATMHLLGSLVAGNAIALLLVWPFIPSSYALALLPMLRATMVSGATMTLLSLPVAIGLLWLSRRYGSHSAVTERRYRVVREMARRRLGLAQPDDAGAG